MSENGTEIAAIKKQIEELEDELSNAKNRLYLLQLEEAGIAVGMLIKSKGKVYRVKGARYLGSSVSKPWIIGYMQRKDGTFSDQIRTIYDAWEPCHE